jgi:hypothetical protein
MQRVQRCCHCWKHRWNWLLGIGCRWVNGWFWMSGTSSKRRCRRYDIRENKNYHKVLMCKKGRGARSLLLAVKYHRCFCSSTSNRGTDLAQKGRICKFSGMFQTRSLIFRDLRNGTSSDYVSDFAKLQHAFICAPCGETSWTVTIFSRSCLAGCTENTQKLVEKPRRSFWLQNSLDWRSR